jgi:hypothetical protein
MRSSARILDKPSFHIVDVTWLIPIPLQDSAALFRPLLRAGGSATIGGCEDGTNRFVENRLEPFLPGCQSAIHS